MLERSAFLYPNNIALVQDSRRISYSELKKMVDSLSAGLVTKEGVNPGDRIGVLSLNSIEFLLLYLAAARSGAILVPLNFRLSSEEMAFMVEDTKPVLFFSHPNFHEIVEGLSGSLGSARGLYSTGQAKGKFKSFQDLMGEQNGSNEKKDFSSDTPIVILYTAAMSGKAKGAVLTQGNIVAASVQLGSTEGLSFSVRDVFLAFLPFSHVFGLVGAMGMFQVAGVNVIQDRFDAKAAVELINSENVTAFFTFSPILKSIMDVISEKNLSMPSLRLVMGLEGPDVIEKLRNLTNAKFWTTYGQAETTSPVTFGLFDSRPGSAGRPSPLARIKMLDSDDNPVREGEVGEIAVQGPLVFKGYWRLDEDTDDAFRGGWHHTGDLGQFDKDGYLWYKGRKPEKELIKPGGENVYPAEVEAAALSHPSIAEAVVIGVPHPKWGEGIKLICVLKPGTTIGEAEVIEFVGSKIARYKKPHFVTFVDAFPKTAAGKIDRAQVKATHGNA